MKKEIVLASADESLAGLHLSETGEPALEGIIDQ